jgi:hypothetical protein
MRKLVALAVVGGALACSHSVSPIVPVSEYTLVQAADSVPLSFGRVVKVGGAVLEFTEVNDSRCPIGATCVWEGDGAARIVVSPPCVLAGCEAAAKLLELHTRLEPKAGEGWGHRVQLVGLYPYPELSKPADRGKYVAWVRVTLVP